MKICILLLLLFLNGCKTNKGFSGISKDIIEAKKRGVFILEYNVIPNPYEINDSLRLTIKQAWIEQKWGYGDNDKTIHSNGYQLYINTTAENETKIEDANANFGIDFEHYLRESGNDSYVGDFDAIPIDTIKYLTQLGANLIGDSVYNYRQTCIGEKVIVRALPPVCCSQKFFNRSIDYYEIN